MEKWDLYDKDFNKLNKTVNRGDFLNDNEYHLVINAWIINDNNELLLSQRCANKAHAFMWECTGGSALMGESDIEACIREAKEELNVDISKAEPIFIGSKLRYFKGCPDILRAYLFKNNTQIDEVKIQEEEVMNAMWADKNKLLELNTSGKLLSNEFFKEILDIINK